MCSGLGAEPCTYRAAEEAGEELQRLRLQNHYPHRDWGGREEHQEQGYHQTLSSSHHCRMTLYLFQFAALNNLPNQIAGFLQDNVDDQVLQSEDIAE